MLCCPSLKVQILAQFSGFTVAQFSCCTSTKVQILAQLACFTNTKVQILTQKLAGDEVAPRTHAPNKTQGLDLLHIAGNNEQEDAEEEGVVEEEQQAKVCKLSQYLYFYTSQAN